MPQKAMVQGHKINNKIWKFASFVIYFASSFSKSGMQKQLRKIKTKQVEYEGWTESSDR